ncbi:MAG: DUF4124 domain-containing protein [Gammaproteobacteria bacterium]|nr:DUF4124 domain-containing protein [Gammaproteobacteria bacterium]
MLLPLLLAGLLIADAQAAVYKWQDESGATRYGDNPPADAVPEPVELPEISIMPGTPATKAAPAADEGESGAAAGAAYSGLAITSPPDGQTIRTDTGRVEIAVRVAPPLQSTLGHRLFVVVDGQRFAAGENGLAVKAARGTHRAQAEVVDAEGRILARSAPASFTIRPDSLQPFPRELRQVEGVRPVK